MQVECPECHGARRLRYIDPMPSLGVTTFAVGATATDITYSAHEEKCRTCDGMGRVKSTARVPVMQDGRRVGTVPHDFDPRRIKSTNWLYDPREGDFVLKGSVWVAARTLGPGDIEAVPGFVWDWERGN